MKDLPLGITLITTIIIIIIIIIIMGQVAQAVRRLATDWRPGFEPGSRRGEDFSSPFVSRLVLEFTQPPIK